MVAAARIIYATKWKSDVCLNLEERENKLSEYAVKAKLTTNLKNRSISKFEEKQNIYCASRRYTQIAYKCNVRDINVALGRKMKVLKYREVDFEQNILISDAFTHSK